MLQGQLFSFNSGEQPNTQLYPCPICHQFKLVSEDPNDPRVDWVALGEVVCGRVCHEKAYEMLRRNQPELPLLLGGP